VNRELRVKLRDLPMRIVLEQGQRKEAYVLKPAGKGKVGMHLVKPEQIDAPRGA